MSKEKIEAIKLVGKTEGIFLDPVYTGRLFLIRIVVTDKLQ